MILEPGMEVECISLGVLSQSNAVLIQVGGKYIINQVYPVGTWPFVPEDQISLVGIERNPAKSALYAAMIKANGMDPNNAGAPTTFSAANFRPIRKSKTDISVFKKLADVVSTKVPEHV